LLGYSAIRLPKAFDIPFYSRDDESQFGKRYVRFLYSKVPILIHHHKSQNSHEPIKLLFPNREGGRGSMILREGSEGIKRKRKEDERGPEDH
jgi:hypothetical protein